LCEKRIISLDSERTFNGAHNASEFLLKQWHRSHK